MAEYEWNLTDLKKIPKNKYNVFLSECQQKNNYFAKKTAVEFCRLFMLL